MWKVLKVRGFPLSLLDKSQHRYMVLVLGRGRDSRFLHMSTPVSIIYYLEDVLLVLDQDVVEDVGDVGLER